jgi:two-component system, cell cycle sensor histidine kinase and response regulator CckA
MNRLHCDTDATAKLIVIEGRLAGRQVVLDREALLGRGAEALLSFEETAVSRNHAKIERQRDGAYVLVDLDSTNGTFVNGARVQRKILAPGDRIGITAEVTLLFVRHEPEQDRAVQRQKLEVFGVFADGAIHDLNNVLAAMTAVTDYLEGLPHTTPLSDASARECVTDLRAALKRATGLTRRLRSFTRAEAEPHASVDLSAICDETARLVRRALGRDIELTVDVEPGLMMVGDGGALHQMILNLCVNARDAMSAGGRLTVAARTADADELEGMGLDGDAPYLCVSVADTGVGIAPADRDAVFQPFYTTKAHGTGLGLAIVREVVLTHGGKLTMDSEVGRGTRFTAYFRAISSASVSGTRASIVKRAAVLIVDDDQVVRRGVARTLSRMGYRISQAACGAAGLEHLRRERPDVVLLDLNLGDMRGEEVLRILRREADPPPVIILSGELTPSREQDLRRDGACGFVHKPSPTSRLVRAVEKALQTAAADDLDEPTTERLLAIDPSELARVERK